MLSYIANLQLSHSMTMSLCTQHATWRHGLPQIPTAMLQNIYCYSSKGRSNSGNGCSTRTYFWPYSVWNWSRKVMMSSIEDEEILWNSACWPSSCGMFTLFVISAQVVLQMKWQGLCFIFCTIIVVGFHSIIFDTLLYNITSSHVRE